MLRYPPSTIRRRPCFFGAQCGQYPKRFSEKRDINSFFSRQFKLAVSVESLGDGEVILLSGGVTARISPLSGGIAGGASVAVTTGYTGSVAQVDATGGGNIRYTLIRGGDDFAVGATNGLLSLTLAQSEATTLTAGVQISDAGTLE